MKFVTGLQCTCCGTLHSTRVPYTCPACGMGGLLDVQYDYAAIGRLLSRRTLAQRPERNHWRYREMLPIEAEARLPALSVGWTPLTPAPALARHIGVATLYLKDDGRNPTGSLKDRASAIGVVKACETEQKFIACASTGNAASSLAGMAASMGLHAIIFVPDRAPEPKVTQLLIFGATVLRVNGSYEDAFQLCQCACEKWGWYNRNCAINPYLIEGKKTVALEAAEQLAWEMPDWVAVSVGDGCTVAGVWKGFRELRTLGIIERAPRILGVQAAGAAPVTEAFEHGELRPVNAQTIADSIAVGVPRNWRKAVDAVRESGGTMINVADEEILDAMRCTGRLTGIFAEPAAATGVAGLHAAIQRGIIPPTARALAMITGNGLKDVRSAQSAVGSPFEVPPNGDGLEELLRQQGVLSS